MAKTNSGFSIYKLFGKIGDLLFLPIIFIALFTSFSMLTKKQKQKPMSVFGYSLVTVLSGSMVNDGFLIGDTLFAKETKTENIKLGDVVAFYNYRDPLDLNVNREVVIKYNYDGGLALDTSESNIVYGVNLKDYPKQKREGEKTVEDAINSKVSVFFHRVIGIYVDPATGNVFFQTKGSNNSSPDDYIRSDFIVGKYVNTPRAFRDIMFFCGTSRGMIILICIPLSILVLTQSFSLIRQIEIISYEKQLVSKKKKFTDPDIQKGLNGNEIELYNKVYLYYITPAKEREAIKYFMWGELLTSRRPSKKQRNELSTLQNTEIILKTSNNKYWQEWSKNTSGFAKRKIVKFYESMATTNMFKNTQNVAPKEEKVGVNKTHEHHSEQTLEQTNLIISKVTGSGIKNKEGEAKTLKTTNKNVDSKDKSQSKLNNSLQVKKRTISKPQQNDTVNKEKMGTKKSVNNS